jgi:hypothetical protein
VGYTVAEEYVSYKCALDLQDCISLSAPSPYGGHHYLSHHTLLDKHIISIAITTYYI